MTIRVWEAPSCLCIERRGNRPSWAEANIQIGNGGLKSKTSRGSSDSCCDRFGEIIRHGT